MSDSNRGSFPRWNLAALLTLGLLVAVACSGGGGLPPNTVAVLLDTPGGTITSTAGHVITMPPGALSGAGIVTVEVLPGAPGQPTNGEFLAVGPYVRIHFGEATLEAAFTIEAPYAITDPDDTFLVWYHDGIFTPLDTTVDPVGGSLTADFDFDPDTFEVLGALPETFVDGNGAQEVFIGVCEASAFGSRPPHVPWPSYNAYFYDLFTEQFVEFIHQGTVTQSPPALGAKPGAFVHGLGSDISGQEFVNMAQYLFAQGTVTGVVGFEYDTLATLDSRGQMLNEAYQHFVTYADPGVPWRHVAHSQGTIVSRWAWEQTGGLPVPATGNQMVLIAGPHLGTPLINALEANLSLWKRVIRYASLNEFFHFVNADGVRCQVSVNDPGWSQITVGAPFLAGLNANVMHTNAGYRTIAGTRATYLGIIDLIIGLHLDDGLVDKWSANASIVQQTELAEVPDNHHVLVVDTENSIPVVNQFLQGN